MIASGESSSSAHGLGNCYADRPSPTSSTTSRSVPLPPTSVVVTSSSSLNESATRQNWLSDPAAWDHFCSVVTGCYSLFIIVFAVLIELSQKFTPDEWMSETLFYSFMYGAGVVFLGYCYIFKLHPSMVNFILLSAAKRRWLKSGIPPGWHIARSSHVGEGAGSLYLRLGTLCFGSSGIVLFCLEIFMCLSDHRCYNYQLGNWILACLFTFVQMHFLFCNSKIAIVDSKNLAKLGTMHLLAVNIWTWLRFVIAKNASAERTASTIVQLGGTISRNYANNSNATTIPNVRRAHRYPNLHSIYSFSYFGDFASLLTTGIIEYSVIGAAMMIVLWRSIDINSRRHVELVGRGGEQTLLKRKQKVRIDCSASSAGLFAGVLFLIGALVSVGIHSFLHQHSNSHAALLVFRLSDMALFCFTLVGCSLGLYRMRHLQYQPQRSSSSVEFLDEILLVIGLVGELIHSSTGVMCWISTQSERQPPNARMEAYMLFVFLTRIIQVVVQAVFILLARRLRTLSLQAVARKPGKQFVTFLLLANVSLFLFHTLEGMQSVFGDTVIASRRARPYASLIAAVAPLVVFYRFHSSVCLAEIWKHCYDVKKHKKDNTNSNAASLPSSTTLELGADEESV